MMNEEKKINVATGFLKGIRNALCCINCDPKSLLRRISSERDNPGMTQQSAVPKTRVKVKTRLNDGVNRTPMRSPFSPGFES